MKRAFKILRARLEIWVHKQKDMKIVTSMLLALSTLLFCLGSVVAINRWMSNVDNGEGLFKSWLTVDLTRNVYPNSDWVWMIAIGTLGVIIISLIMTAIDKVNESGGKSIQPTKVYTELEPIQEILEALVGIVAEYDLELSRVKDITEERKERNRELNDVERFKVEEHRNNYKRLLPIYGLHGIIKTTDRMTSQHTYKDLLEKRQKLQIILHLFNTSEVKNRLSGLVELNKGMGVLNGTIETQEEFLKPLVELAEEVTKLNNQEVYKNYVEQLGLDEKHMPEFTKYKPQQRLTAEDIMKQSIQNGNIEGEIVNE